MISIEQLTVRDLANLFDHTLLKAYATEADFAALCADARKYGFKMVAINSCPVALCRKLLADSPVHVGAAISFPLGQTDIETKCFETRRAIEQGADEIDYVINVGKAKEGDWAYIREEMKAIVSVCREKSILSKVIFENCYLTREEISCLAKIAKDVRPDFIKTSTGFGSGGATAEDVKLMKSVVGEDVKVKAAGGIRSWAACRAMLEAGAERIGTSSSIKILEEFQAERSL